MTIQELVESGKIDEEALVLKDFNDCIAAIASRAGQPEVLAYDLDKIIAKLMKGGMDWDDACEYFEYNIGGSWLGDNTPIFLEWLPKIKEEKKDGPDTK